MKSKLALLTIAAMSMAGSPQLYSHPERNESDEDRKKRIEEYETKRNTSYGLKKFVYGENRIVWAINKKNADKKAVKNNWPLEDYKPDAP